MTGTTGQAAARGAQNTTARAIRGARGALLLLAALCPFKRLFAHYCVLSSVVSVKESVVSSVKIVLRSMSSSSDTPAPTVSIIVADVAFFFARREAFLRASSGFSPTP